MGPWGPGAEVGLMMKGAVAHGIPWQMPTHWCVSLGPRAGVSLLVVRAVSQWLAVGPQDPGASVRSLVGGARS